MDFIKLAALADHYGVKKEQPVEIVKSQVLAAIKRQKTKTKRREDPDPYRDIELWGPDIAQLGE